MGKTFCLHTGIVQYRDGETRELMWLLDASDEKTWWKVSSPDLYEAVYELRRLPQPKQTQRSRA